MRLSRFGTACIVLASPYLLALSPHKSLTQYARFVWTQAEGLPQDAVRVIAQTADGYLWLGTDEGLARFDGYSFVTFTKHNSALPSNSILTLAAGPDGSLWIGTASGLTRYRNREFKTFTTNDGLPSDVVSSLGQGQDGVLWMVAGSSVTRLEHGAFTNYPIEQLLPIRGPRTIYEDAGGAVWVGGIGGLIKRTQAGFVSVLNATELRGNNVSNVIKDRAGNLWVGGSKGLILVAPDGKVRKFDTADGLTDDAIRALAEDRNGNLWVGTNFGLCRLEGGRFVAAPTESGYQREWVRSLFEDREGNLWVGMNRGLNQFHDERFTMFGRIEGLPSDEPVAIHQDVSGKVWVGYHGDGLVALDQGKPRIYTMRDGLPSNSIISIRDGRDGDLLVSNNGGLSRMHAGHFSTYALPQPDGSPVVWDGIEDSNGELWVATMSGVYQMEGRGFRNVVAGGPLLDQAAVVLSEGLDGSMWAGTYGNGLWHIQNGKSLHYTTSDALGSNEIRSLYQDPDGTLWIGTLGGGLNAFRGGLFKPYTVKDGLLSDNISHVEDDGKGWLWLSTTRGINRVSKQQLYDFAAGRIKALTPINYGVEDGLRSAQCAAAYQGGGGTRTQDGRIWFTTSRGIATIDSGAPESSALIAPVPRVVEVSADGKNLDPANGMKFQAGTRFISFRYAAIFLSAPARVRYAYKLAGLNSEWIPAEDRQVVMYNTLPHGRYAFTVKATLPNLTSQETTMAFEVLPFFYQTEWFLFSSIACAFAMIYWAYQIRVRRIHSRFSLVLQERTRLAREIHDTLVQAFFGISSHLDVLSANLDGDRQKIRQSMDLARKMARHSLNEARRSVLDLRTIAVDDEDLASALSSAASHWADGSPVRIMIDVSGIRRKLPEQVVQNVLRIAQEAVTNALKHAQPETIWVNLEMEAAQLCVRVRDDGRGFPHSDSFSASAGHFGLVGMRERAQRVGGQLKICSQIGTGTEVEILVPL